jgi:hypothetical protein
LRAEKLGKWCHFAPTLIYRLALTLQCIMAGRTEMKTYNVTFKFSNGRAAVEQVAAHNARDAWWLIQQAFNAATLVSIQTN